MAFSLLADVEVRAITDLTPEWLQAEHIRLLLLDFDNTIVAYTATEPPEAFLTWRAALAAAGIDIMVVSNSRRSRRVPDFCEALGIPYIRHAGKPSPKGLRRAMERFGVTPRETAMAGDQTFTDILGGNLAGVTSILVRPIHFSNPFQVLRFWIEQPWIRLGRLQRKK